MKTQEYKSVDIRTIVNNALAGRPINVPARNLFDAPDIDIDDPREFMSADYDDDLEIIQRQRDILEERLNAQEKQKTDVKHDNEKGGMNNETSSQNETQTPLP